MDYLLVKFSTLKVGDMFEVYGNRYFGYTYPKICLCEKTSRKSAHSITVGSSFNLEEEDMVIVEKINKET